MTGDDQPTRFLTAVELTGRFLTARVASVARRDRQELVLKVTTQRGPDIDDWPYAEWDFERQMAVPEGWDAGTNPWRSCRYVGPPKNRPSSKSEADQIVRDLYADMGAAPGKLADLIEAHMDSALVDDSRRAALRAFLDEDFDELSITDEVHGDDADAAADLTLFAAQDIQQTLRTGEQLDHRQLEQAVVLLEDAPWRLGYWGAVKALLKAGPTEELADTYAYGVARLSSQHPESHVSETLDIQDLELLTNLFGRPRKKTVAYMARRVRRDLAALAKRSPDMYARVAARMLTAWDEPLSGAAYAPAYVLLGAARTLDSGSRCVQVPAEMASRRDPHPELWDERPLPVRGIFTSVSASIEMLTWAFQVLESSNAAPVLRPKSIGMALESTYPPLRRLGCAAVPLNSEVYASLTAGQWRSFFLGAEDAEVTQAANVLAAHDPLDNVGAALTSILSEPEAVTDRRARLALLYLAAPRRVGNRAAADAAAVVATVERFQLEYRSLWAPVTARMTPQELVGIYHTLAEDDADDAALDSIADEIVKKHWLTPDSTLECVGSDNPKVVELGWRLVEANGGGSFFFGRVVKNARPSRGTGSAFVRRVVSQALPRATSTTEATELAIWALSTRFDRSELAGLLAETSVGRGALWDMSAHAENADASDLARATPQVMRAVCDAVSPQQVSSATPAQLSLVGRYLLKYPGRIGRDLPFGFAALKSVDPALQAAALRRLATKRALPRAWLTLAESKLPTAIDVAREYITSLEKARQVRDAILTCLNSRDPAVREMGIELFEIRESLVSDQAIWTALAVSDNRRAQNLVANAALAGNIVDRAVLHDFDRRILTERRASRRAKEMVKQRLETDENSNVSISDERIASLLTMARGRLAQDREWALMRLASLALHGSVIEGLEFSLTTTGTVIAADVLP